ncbi:hypothetical protein P3S68_016246 [Capsicum galapagoense]
MDGLGAAMPPSTDVLVSAHSWDIAETLSTEVAEDSSHVAKLRTALEAVDAKKRKDIMSQSSVNTLDKSRKKAMLASLAELSERMPSLLDIDHPCAQRHIEEARHVFEVLL